MACTSGVRTNPPVHRGHAKCALLIETNEDADWWLCVSPRFNSINSNSRATVDAFTDALDFPWTPGERSKAAPNKRQNVWPQRDRIDPKLRSKAAAADVCRIYCVRRRTRGARLPQMQRGWQWGRNQIWKFDWNSPRLCDAYVSLRTPGYTHKHTHARTPHSHSAFTRAITGSWIPPSTPQTPSLSFFTFISSFISLFTGWAGFLLLLFSGGLPSFSVSAMFSLKYFCQYLRGPERVGGLRGGWKRDGKAVYSCQTAPVLQLLRGPCDAGDAAEGLWYPAKSAIFRPYLARSVRQWWSASVCQRRGWVRGKNETGGGASAETLYDASVSRGSLFLLAFPSSAVRAVASTSAPWWFKHASCKQVTHSVPLPHCSSCGQGVRNLPEVSRSCLIPCTMTPEDLEIPGKGAAGVPIGCFYS